MTWDFNQIPILMIIAFLISALLTQHFSRPQTAFYMTAKPNARSLHTHPIPLNGGIAILTALTVTTLFACLLYVPAQPLLWIGISGLLIATISFIDDCRDVPALYRLIIHLLAAYLLLERGELWLATLTLPGIAWTWSPLLCYIASLLFVVWMTNLYNFMDGMDGFAGGMAVFGFGSFAVLGGLNGELVFMLVNLIVVSACCGFLLFNFPPARIFMGDVGASSLGFLAAAFSLWGHRDHIFPLWVALLLFSPFIVDATVTLLRRLLCGEKIWLAHKSHYYQRMVQLGWGHKRTVLWEYVLMIACSISTIIAFLLPVYIQWSLLAAWCLIYSGLMCSVRRLEQKNQLSFGSNKSRE
jgi:UDP-N-acetylmuramyl pentapeptide phosphotransferase/UDP-N-acetylglucosamine-1-phosphate transferase